MTDHRAEVAMDVDADQIEPVEPRPGENRLTRRRLIWRRFLRNKTAVVGAVIIILLIMIAVVGPYLTPWAYDEIDRRAYLKPPSDTHPLGTTQVSGPPPSPAATSR